MFHLLSKKVAHFSSLVKIAHTIFAFPFALVGFFMGLQDTGRSDFPYTIFFLVCLCVFFARNAAMAFNRLVDTRMDKENKRTAERELPKGLLSTDAVRYFVLLNILLFCTGTFFINSLCFALSPLALLILLGYSYTKHFTFLCHFVLGLSLALAPLGAFFAIQPMLYTYMLWLCFSVLFWVSGFDILYALQDFHFDKAKGLFSMPTFLGPDRARKFSRYLHSISLVCLFFFGYSAGLHWIFWLGFTIFSFLIFLQHRLLRTGNLAHLNLAFFTNNGVASLVFCTCTLLDIYLY